MTPDTLPPLRPLHYDLYADIDVDPVVRVACWCILSADHSHAQWLAAGSPNSMGTDATVGSGGAEGDSLRAP